jgi:DNA-binding transcriptional LysR family regulator
MEMDVDLRNLRTFTAVADLGSISMASKSLRCVQSNVTTRVKALEAELGISLFYRSRSGMMLTSAGETFLPFAKEVIHAAERARASLDRFSELPKLLRVGSMETTLAVRLPAIIPSFRRDHPALRLEIVSGPTDELVQHILDNKIDVALIGGKFPHPDLRGHPLFAEEMVLVRALNSREEDLKSSTVLVFKQGCSYREYTRRWMRLAGLGPNETFELGTLDGILGCVASGVGVTCLPRSVVESSQYREHVQIQTLDDPERFIDTYAVENVTAVRNGAVAAFIAALTSVGQARTLLN